MKKVFVVIFFALSLLSAHAQRRGRSTQVFDTTKRTVVITSAYKPVLKPAAKINFSAGSPVSDSSRPTLLYNVPAQNLFFTYQPASLKPLALSVDTSLNWVNSNFIKLGFGNYSSPFAQTGLSFGDGKGSVVNLHAKHISQKGSLPYQQYAKTEAEVTGIYSTNNNIEWRGKADFERSTQYYYGYMPDSLKYSKDSLRQRYSTLNLMAGFRNKEVNSFGISYDPSLAITAFGDNRSGRETDVLLNAPLTKTFNEAIGFSVGFTADITSYKTFNKQKINNNLYYLSPSILLKKEGFTLNAGILPSWDNNAFKLLPNFTALVKVKDEKFVLQGGWIGYYQKNTYRTLAAFNPWIAQPQSLLNTRITEQFFGFKGSGGSHFTYNAKLSVQSYKNAALFLNDTADGKTFRTIYEPSMKALKIHGEVGYTVQENFSMLAGATVSRYTGLDQNDKAWGLLPVEITGALRWQVLKDLQFKSDVFFWDGPRYLTKKGESERLKGAYDVNAGVEFTIVPKLNLWLQFNNIFNNKYQRWNQYQVLGFNVLGGIVYSFSQPSK